MKKCYEIAGIKLTLETEQEVPDYKFYDLFRAADDALPDYYFKYTEVESIKVDDDAEFIYSNEQFDVYMKDGIEYRYYKPEKKDADCKYDAYIYLIGQEGQFCYKKGCDIKKRIGTSFLLFNNQMFEKMLLEHDAFVLHSSYIIYNGKAIVFSAPSGTGKSTQADLWEKYVGVTIVNGDRSILKRENGKWFVHSLPMCGSSNICLNESAPLDSVILLKQGTENILKPAGKTDALNRLLKECTVNRWNEDAMNKLFDLLIDIMNKTHVYAYSCTKEKEAVDVLKKEIDSDRQ